jgi:hypothetical protein
VTHKPDSPDYPFGDRRVKRQHIEEIARKRPSARTVADLKEGLDWAKNKLGYACGKQREDNASAEQIAHYKARERSVSETIELATEFLERHQASVDASRRKTGRLAVFSQLAVEFLRQTPGGSSHQYWVWLCQRPGVKKDSRPNGQTIIRIAGREVQYSSLKDILYRARKRTPANAQK